MDWRGFRLSLHTSSKNILGIIIVCSGFFIIHPVNLTYAQDYGSLFYTPSDTPFGAPCVEWITNLV